MSGGRCRDLGITIGRRRDDTVAIAFTFFVSVLGPI